VSALTLLQVRWLLEVMLPLKTFTLEDVLRLVQWTQRRNHAVYLAHRKRREEEGCSKHLPAHIEGWGINGVVELYNSGSSKVAS